MGIYFQEINTPCNLSLLLASLPPLTPPRPSLLNLLSQLRLTPSNPLPSLLQLQLNPRNPHNLLSGVLLLLRLLSLARTILYRLRMSTIRRLSQHLPLISPTTCLTSKPLAQLLLIGQKKLISLLAETLVILS